MSDDGPAVVAFYLPQFHPIPENDDWWGTGFTEWTNVARARPLFRDHYQPDLPSELGFYDLRVPETRAAQAVLASEFGVTAFCYWRYWFGGRQLLERPFEEVLASGEPGQKFCAAWANQSWSGIWHGAPDRILVEQTYPGDGDYEAHFYAMLPAFLDARYFRVDERPVFYVYRPQELPDPGRFVRLWRDLAVKEGLPGLYLVGEAGRGLDPREDGFDARVRVPTQLVRASGRVRRRWQTLRRQPTRYPMRRVIDDYVSMTFSESDHPCVIPAWDNTPRSGLGGLVLEGADPDLFEYQVRAARLALADAEPARQVIFLKSWNEWAEGNHVEPCARFGRAYLHALKSGMSDERSSR